MEINWIFISFVAQCAGGPQTTGFCSDCCPTGLSENDRLDGLMSNETLAREEKAFFCQRILKRKAKVLEATRVVYV